MADPLQGNPSLSIGHGRLCVLLAALLWSTSGAFNKILTQDTPLKLNVPTMLALQIACGRALFAGLFLLPSLRCNYICFRPGMVFMVGCFALMNATFVWSMSAGTAANAIFLQYTAPMWMYLASVCCLGERANKRNLIALAIGSAGIGIIVTGGWKEDQLGIVGIALISGLAYAGVMLFLRVFRDVSSRWLTVLNHLCGGLVLVPFVVSSSLPSWPQIAVLAVYGGLQMGLPYWLVARGLRVVSPQEAGTITLLEPILNPLWAYLVVSEIPTRAQLLGGAFIVGALAWRYWPRQARPESITSSA